MHLRVEICHETVEFIQAMCEVGEVILTFLVVYNVQEARLLTSDDATQTWLCYKQIYDLQRQTNTYRQTYCTL